MRFMTPEMFGSSLTFSHTQKIKNTILPYIPKQIAGVFIRKETFRAYCVSSRLGKTLKHYKGTKPEFADIVFGRIQVNIDIILETGVVI